MSRDSAYLLDIFKAAKLALSYLEGKTREEFFKDAQCQDAVIRVTRGKETLVLKQFKIGSLFFREGSKFGPHHSISICEKLKSDPQFFFA